jgi:hypothetical protein
MRATFVDHPPPVWQAFCSTFYGELLGLRPGDPDPETLGFSLAEHGLNDFFSGNR